MTTEADLSSIPVVLRAFTENPRITCRRNGPPKPNGACVVYPIPTATTASTIAHGLTGLSSEKFATCPAIPLGRSSTPPAISRWCVNRRRAENCGERSGLPIWGHCPRWISPWPTIADLRDATHICAAIAPAIPGRTAKLRTEQL